jgi:hypothetical protein
VLPHIARVYVDPQEWSFRTFENIIPLDRMFREMQLGFEGAGEIAPGILRATLTGGAALAALDELPLYVTPLNAQSRGGRRYIFHHHELAAQLTAALKATLPESMRAGFVHVNPVFRCNRFEPGDEPFHPHVDTPYYDEERGHISRHTLLLYLTGGRAAPALQIEDVRFDELAPMTCVLFHQLYTHAGAAYTDGRKVFLRTELIYEEREVTHEPRIGQLFSKAVYLTGESVTSPELAHDADGAYNRVAAAHWTGAIDEAKDPFVLKQYRDVQWLANGFDFWFPKHVPLAECASLLLLDYFNCKIGDDAFHALCTSRVVRGIDSVDDFIAALPRAGEPALCVLDKATLFPSPEDGNTCCPQHTGDRYDPTISDDVIELYAGAQKFARARIGPAPIWMMGQEVFVDPDRFLVDGNKIHVLSAQALTPVNFASCWNCPTRPPNYVDIDVSVRVLQPLVPPIFWAATQHAHHLMFDFFRNGWCVSHKLYDVPVPVIRDVDETAVDFGRFDEPWIRAANRAEPDHSFPQPRRSPWWVGYGASGTVIREVFAED